MEGKLSTNETSYYDKDRLEKIYDICNKLFKNKDECFYTTEEIKELKKDKKNVFL